MGRLPKYDHVEREAMRKGISRQPDPLPRGAVVAGEQREIVERRLKESALARVGELEAAVAEMGARLERVQEVVRAAIEERRAFHEHRKDGATRMDRIEWQIANTFLTDRVDALTPEDREWAEGEET